MKLSLLIFASILSTVAVVGKEATHHLRAAEDDEDRDLASASSGSSMISFSLASAVSLDACFDTYSFCKEYADAQTSAWAGTFGGDAYAEATMFLYAESVCLSCAKAHSKACAFTKANGKLNVTTAIAGGYKAASLSLALDTCTATLAVAATEADALAFTKVGASAYTDLKTYCDSINQMSPLCGGVSASKLTTIGKAAAGAKGQAGSLASSGTVSNTRAAVEATGTSIQYINGMIGAIAKSWSYSNSYAMAQAMAYAMTEVCTGQFQAICSGVHETICADSEHVMYESLCHDDNYEINCAAAWDFGAGYTEAVAMACAEASATAFAATELEIEMSANVDCSVSVPKLGYKSAKAPLHARCG